MPVAFYPGDCCDCGGEASTLCDSPPPILCITPDGVMTDAVQNAYHVINADHLCPLTDLDPLRFWSQGASSGTTYPVTAYGVTFTTHCDTLTWVVGGNVTADSPLTADPGTTVPGCPAGAYPSYTFERSTVGFTSGTLGPPLPTLPVTVAVTYHYTRTRYTRRPTGGFCLYVDTADAVLADVTGTGTVRVGGSCAGDAPPPPPPPFEAVAPTGMSAAVTPAPHCRHRPDDPTPSAEVAAARLSTARDWHRCGKPGFVRLNTLVTECRGCGVEDERRCGPGSGCPGYEAGGR